MIDTLTARAEASAMFLSSWDTSQWLGQGLPFTEPPLIRWEGIADPSESPSPDAPHARFTFDPMIGKQGSLAGDTGTRLWDELGLIMVQSFGPLSSGYGLQMAEYMAIMAQRVYQGKTSPNCMWFRNCRVVRVGASGAWYQYNTIIEFDYNQMR